MSFHVSTSVINRLDQAIKIRDIGLMMIDNKRVRFNCQHMSLFVKLEISQMSQKGDMSDDKNIRIL